MLGLELLRAGISMKTAFLKSAAAVLIWSCATTTQVSAGDQDTGSESGTPPSNGEQLNKQTDLTRQIDGETTHTYLLQLEAGGSAEVVFEQMGADIVVLVNDPAGQQVGSWDSPTGGRGREKVAFTANQSGRYELLAKLFDPMTAGTYHLSVNHIRNPVETAAEVRRLKHQTDTTIAWLRNNAVSLTTVAAGHPRNDLQALKSWIGDARVVALGEATHGTSEFFQFKHRMLEFLVEDMGFNIFAIEATMPESMDINRYVLHGEGDVYSALASQYFWTWDTEEVIALLEWMRAYNADASHPRKVAFFGFDVQAPVRATRVAIAGLETVAPELVKEARGHLVDLQDPFLARVNRAELDKTTAGDLADRMIRAYDAHRTRLQSILGDEQYALARQHAVVLKQWARQAASSSRTTRMTLRDLGMAENVEWILDHVGPDSKMVMWAHNWHVGRNDTTARSMGTVLKQRLGDKYRSFGFLFQQGQFNAWGTNSLGLHSRPSAEPGSLEEVLGRVGSDLMAVNLTGIPDAEVAEWFATPRKSFSVGAVYREEYPNSYLIEEVFSEIYDVLVFFRDTSAARFTFPIPPVPVEQKALINGDFESHCGSKRALDAWWQMRASEKFGYSIGTTAHGLGSGKCALRLAREFEFEYGEVAHGLGQTIKAGPLAGKTVRVSTQYLLSEQPAAKVYLKVSWKASAKDEEPAASKTEYWQLPATDKPSSWQLFAAEVEIPTDAETLQLQFTLSGQGELLVDEIVISPI